jgi:hypothetical protein
MTTEQLQFIFSLFSFVGVVGILFYIILERANREEKDEYLGNLRDELVSLKEYVYRAEEDVKENEEPVVENMKEKIIALYEEGADIMLIENALNIPKAKIEMVLKFHHLNKSDNWRESVDNNL